MSVILNNELIKLFFGYDVFVCVCATVELVVTGLCMLFSFYTLEDALGL